MPALMHQLCFGKPLRFFAIWMSSCLFSPPIGEDYSIRQHLRLLKWKGEDVAVLEAKRAVTVCCFLLLGACTWYLPNLSERNKACIYNLTLVYYEHNSYFTNDPWMHMPAWRWTQHFRPLPFGSPTRPGSMRRTRADHNRKFRSQILWKVQSKETKDN